MELVRLIDESYQKINELVGSNEAGEQTEKKDASKSLSKKREKGKRLSPEVVELILGEIRAGVKTKREIAEEYEVSEAGIYYIMNKHKVGKIGSKKNIQENNFGGNKPVAITCSHCGNKFKARIDPADKIIKCPDCSEELETESLAI